ncbi:MAG: carboxypeptidase-like regulatory domain-containing protein [Bacteroidota bacterium]
MKELIVLLLVIITVFTADAQVNISGKVKDNKGKPVPGASISLKDTYDGAVSDSSGNYIFTTSEKGEYTFLVTNIGYKSF